MIKSAPQPLRSRPTVSVVIPCYKYGHFLPTCVRSVLEQEDVDVDVLIIDDASPDDSADIARRIAAEDDRVRVAVHEVNQRHIATYNEGLACATGEYVLLLSADDMLAPRGLANAAALMQTHPEVGLVYGFTRSFSNEPPAARVSPRSWSIWSGQEWLGLLCRHVSNPIYTPEAVMRTKTLQDLVGYDARLPHAADFLMWLRTATRGSIGRVNGVDLAYYRQHGENMHKELYPGALRDLTERNLAFGVLFDEDGDRLADVARLRSAARRGVAREALFIAQQAYYQGGRPTEEEAEVLARLVAFAEQICPESRTFGLRRSYETLVARARRGKGPLVPAHVLALRDRAVGHLRWRRWRRTGIEVGAGAC
ncbi:glycosyltransferase [Micromonospora sp. NPDC005173]|uniref:glycosyltransferase n=1 Tax=Micromonospora sp. NPDC005173 TaxID=3157165 RepID=UPI0033A730AC